MHHRAKVSKDRTALFTGKPEFIPTIQTGVALLDWCNLGTDAPAIVTYEQMQEKIKACATTKELNALYHAHPKYQQVLNHEFATKDEQLKTIVNQNTFTPNGTNT